MEEIRNFLVSPLSWFCAVFIAVILDLFLFLMVEHAETERHLRLLTLLSMFCPVSVGLWYTYETRGLRIQAEKQLSVIRNQFQVANAPSLFPSVIHRDRVKELVMEGKITQSGGEIEYSKEQLAEAIK